MIGLIKKYKKISTNERNQLHSTIGGLVVPVMEALHVPHCAPVSIFGHTWYSNGVGRCLGI